MSIKLQKINSRLKAYENKKNFRQNEAWNIFRIFAYGEAIGWTLLIIGLLINKFNLPGHAYSIIMAF